MSPRTKFPTLSPVAAWRLVRIVLIAVFVFLVGRHWYPYYGFTGLLQADIQSEKLLPASLRDTPIFIHPHIGRYDGVYYAQIATSPALRDPELKVAVDDLGYRARRILLSAVAWAVGGGDPVRAVHVYAWLNIVVWFALAGVLWRLLPVEAGGRAAFAFAALLFAGGTLASVRLALTDLAAMTLLAAALLAGERNRPALAAVLTGLGGLARETAMLGLAALLPERPTDFRLLARRAGLFLLAVIPLAGWSWYVWSAIASASAGTANIGWPLGGWILRWQELLRLRQAEPNNWLVVTAWLDSFALLAQMAYILVRPEWRSPWWRVGFFFTLLSLCLGWAVLEGVPGAAVRVLLPLTLAFNVLACRRRAAVVWLVLGNLSIFGGLLSLWAPPAQPHTLAVRSAWGRSCVLETDQRWQVAEWNSKWRWSWCDEAGGVRLRIWPWPDRARVQLQVRGITPRELEVWHDGTQVWQGSIGDRPEWITLPELPVTRGNLVLELRSAGPSTPDGAAGRERTISFACFGARLVE
ncbi:MAG TPA: hypothetical protein VG734_06230 [Lacunisphaera sp.]|nr:hypothetical protein [Lacunisphaera sp.]